MVSDWIWSADHNDWYRVEYVSSGQPVFIWGSYMQTQATPSANVTPSSQLRFSPPYGTVTTVSPQDSNIATPAEPVSQEERSRLPNFIAGTPEQGWYNSLDSSYRMRTGREAHEFFKIGRVFAMLYTEPSSGSERIGLNDDAFTVVRFGQSVFSQIRRFVVVSVRPGFVLACAISTYANRGTLKPGCNPGEHAVIYNTGTDPSLFQGERERGLYKDPIEVSPAQDSDSWLRPESRIRFGKIYSIECNVKVKDIGRVVDQHLSLLTAHYREEEGKFDQYPDC